MSFYNLSYSQYTKIEEKSKVITYYWQYIAILQFEPSNGVDTISLALLPHVQNVMFKLASKIPTRLYLNWLNLAIGA
jgi:hypothetical protein